MGGKLSKLRPFRRKRARLLMVGLDGAGKTTILNKLKLGPRKEETPQNTVPTLGFNVQTIKCENIRMQLWDVGGQDSIRPLWRHYFTGSQALIFVVDANDRVRLPKAKDEFTRIVHDRAMTDVPVLVFANKIDLEGSLTGADLRDALEMNSLVDKSWHVQQCCAITGVGLDDGIKWLSKHIKKI